MSRFLTFPFSFVLLLLLGLTSFAAAQSPLPMRVQDIRVDGLQRLPVERVFRGLGITAGDVIDREDVIGAIRRLYAEGDFEDVQLGYEGEVLVVTVAERPAIASIELDGNRAIGEDDLRKGLQEAGLSEGEVFRRSTLEAMAGELQRQYVAQGRYGADIKTEAVALPRNRVALKITIYEGKSARIRDINIVGNEVYSDKELLDIFELKGSHFWSFFKGDDKYSRESLSGDLESLRSWYLDRGYINISLESTQVAVTADREDVLLAISVDEGERYRIGNIKLAGDLVVDESQLEPLIIVNEGQIFSQQAVTYTTELMTRRLGNEGYTFANVNSYTDINEEDQTVDVTFYVDPGSKVYVRRLDFVGNGKTRDEVLRREMRQFEKAPANTALIDLSRQRLQRLGYFAVVQADTPKVPGTNDEVDVIYNVEEQPSGSIGANVGYSDASGFIFGANVSQNNFRGTGNRVSFSLSRSDVRDSYSFSHFNPYYTLDGVSRGFSLYFSQVDFSETTIASYASNRKGGSVTFGYPISEYSRVSFGVGADNIDLTTGDFVAVDIYRFLETYGYEYNQLSANIGFQTSTLNKGVLPDRGWSQNLNLELATPASDYLYYKLTWTGQRYWPVSNTWTLRSRLDLGFGAGYGDGEVLPFFENFYSGGIGSVRGYESRSLGPLSDGLNFVEAGLEDPEPDPIGGNLMVETGLELIFPTPFAPQSRSIRTFFFVDAGNVFQTEVLDGPYDFDVEELRSSAGVGLTWLTVIGPLSFNVAKALNDQPDDDTEVFQFSIGQVF